MKNILQTTIILCILTFPLVCIASNSKQKVEGWVNGEEAIFSFPVVLGEEIEWNRETTQPNFLEYTFHINIGENSFGFFLYKHPKYTPKKGTFAQLVETGQLSVMKKDNNSFELFRKGKIEIEQNTNIFIKVNDPETFKMIFQTKPSEFTYWFTDENGSLIRGTNQIKYK